jgi:hypothetical protein
MPEAVLIPMILVSFALVWTALGYFLGTRVGERRVLRALANAPRRPTPTDLGNTVARRPQQPDPGG